MRVFIHVACMEGLPEFPINAIYKKEHGAYPCIWPEVLAEIMYALEDSLLIDQPGIKIVRNHVGELYEPGHDDYFDDERVINTQIGTLEEFEYTTLRELWLYSKTTDPDELICYAHTKGVSYAPNYKSDYWRTELCQNIIREWEDCVEILKTVDSCGPRPSARLRARVRPYYRGNFWWAKAGLIAKLVEPKIGCIEEAEEQTNLGKDFSIENWEQYEGPWPYTKFRVGLSKHPRLGAESWVTHQLRAEDWNKKYTWKYITDKNFEFLL
jgi:hypothetical protein